MVRIRSGWLVAVALLALGGTACKKNDDKKTDQPASGEKTAEKAGDKPAAGGGHAAVGGGSVSGAVGDDLALLPADSEIVLGLNFAQIQQSALWKQFSPKFMDKVSGGLTEFKTACGFDPSEVIKSVAIGIKGVGGAGTPDGAVVIHGMDKAKSMACIDKAKVEAAKKDTVITIDGDMFTVKDKKGETTVWTFSNDTTLLGIVGPNANKDTLMTAAKGGSALKTSAAFTGMFGKINSGDSLWYVVNGNAAFMQKASGMGVKPKAIYGSLNVTDGLAVDLHLLLATADEATQLVNMAKGQLGNPQVKQMFDKLDVTADGADVKVGLAMSQQKLMALVGMVGGMMGGMMGGGVGGQ